MPRFRATFRLFALVLFAAVVLLYLRNAWTDDHFVATQGSLYGSAEYQYVHRQQTRPQKAYPSRIMRKPEHKVATIVASMKGDDTSWLFKYFPDWSHNVYVMNDRNAPLTVRKNKGRESVAYLTYIIDNYHNLPKYLIFLHALRYQWHNDDPMYDGVPVLKMLRLPYVEAEGYANLRCTWMLGCPDEVKPRNDPFDPERDDDHLATEKAFGTAFNELFPGTMPPRQVGVPCGAQFALSKAQVLERPLKDYKRYRQWLWDTKLPDNISGRILEYVWHIIMGKPAIHCPSAGDCFCEKYGLCNLTCQHDFCEKRYQLPTYSTIPPGWPEIGPGEDGWPDHGWWEED